MAAVLCLMFLPLVFGAVALIGSMGALSLGTMFAGSVFLLLSGGLVVGALRLASRWEHE